MIFTGYPNNLIVACAVHTLHHKDLFLGYLINRIESDGVEFRSDPLYQLFGDSHSNWARDEILKLGLVSLYHLWERQCAELFKEQEIFQGFSPTKWNGPFDEWAKRVMEVGLDCRHPQPKLWGSIAEAREFSNAYKHGDDPKLGKLYEKYPHFFCSKTNLNHKESRLIDRLRINKEYFKQACEDFAAFWEHLPHEPDYSGKYKIE